MFRIRKFARGLSLQYRVRSQHRHCRSLQRLVKCLNSPIEFVIANDPRIVIEMIKQIDHQFPFGPQTDFGALIHVADVDQNRVPILPPPASNLRNATRKPATIGVSVVIGGRQNMAVDVRCMQDRDANRVGVKRGCSARQRWNRA